MAYQYETVKLEKGMYSAERGAALPRCWRQLRPQRSSYKGTPLEGLDAFQRQLKRFDIQVKGAGSDMVEKFFAHLRSLPCCSRSIVARAVRQGMEEADILPEITATETSVERHGLPLHRLRSAG